MNRFGYTLFAGILTVALPAWSNQLITNGDFETGDLTGWTVTDVNSPGSWFAENVPITPLSGHSTVGPAGGSWYAVSDQFGPGIHALTQSFTVPIGTVSLNLSFQMFVNDWAGSTDCGAGLNISSGAVECGRVDILTGSASPFDTGAGDISNLYLGSDGTNPPFPYTTYNFNLTGLLTPGNTYQLRFAEADDELWFNQGVDNVSLQAVTTPEPASILLLGTVGIASAFVIRRKRRSKSLRP